MIASDRSSAACTGRALATGAVVLGMLAPAPALAADGSQETRAQTLFEVASQLQSSGQIADACPMFAESKRLAAGIGVTLHLADCYERLGRPASAWSQFRAAERLAHERGDERRADLAHARARALEPKLNRLTVAARTGAHDGWQVTVDGAVLPADRWNLPLALDPGDHVVIVEVPGQGPRTARVRLDATTPAATVNADPWTGVAPAVAAAPPTATAAAATTTPPTPTATAPALASPTPSAPVAATSPATPNAPAPVAATSSPTPSRPAAVAATAPAVSPVPTAATTSPPEPMASRPSDGTTRTDGISGTRLGVGIGLAGLGAVGVAFGTFFLVRRSVFISHDCSCDVSLENEASTGATISFGVGGAALASAAVLLLTAPARKPQVGWSLAPVPLMGGAGALVRTSF